MHQKMYVKALVLYLLAWIADAYKPLNLSDMKPDAGGGSGPSIFFPINGNVYPLGYYTVNISIDNPPKYSFILDVDTGSDLTWVPCADGNPAHPYYNPDDKGTRVTCGDDACTSLGDLGYVNIGVPANEQCEYSVDYADGGSSDGVLVRDSIPLTFRDGTTAAPNLTFGCGVSGDNEARNHKNIVGGVLGLGKGESGILHQLSSTGVIRNVVGHCLNGTGGGGYLFFGDLPIFGLAWRQILSDDEHYHLGKATILFDGQTTDIRGLGVTFDSGSTYTYLESLAYEALLDLITNNLKGPLSVADGDPALPICWKDVDNPIETIAQVATYFKTVALNFTDENNVQFEMPPESYLIISDKQNVCLGILNGTEVGLGHMNLIGDISMQNKLVIYDNENRKVGWAAVDTCNKNF